MKCGGAVFSDGSPVTAEDVLSSLELARQTPRFSAGLTGVVAAEAPDDSTVDLPDESTPQTDLPTDDAGSSNMGIVVIGGIAILAVILLGVFLVNRHNKAVDEK